MKNCPFSPDTLKLLKCFISSRHKCRYICTVRDENIEALSSLLKDFLAQKLKLPNLGKIIKSLHPIRILLRKLADKTTKTRLKRKILLQFAIKLILYPILQKHLIPCYGKHVTAGLKKVSDK